MLRCWKFGSIELEWILKVNRPSVTIKIEKEWGKKESVKIVFWVIVEDGLGLKTSSKNEIRELENRRCDLGNVPNMCQREQEICKYQFNQNSLSLSFSPFLRSKPEWQEFSPSERYRPWTNVEWDSREFYHFNSILSRPSRFRGFHLIPFAIFDLFFVVYRSRVKKVS